LPTPARNSAPNVASGGFDGFTATVTLSRFAIFPATSVLWTGRDLITTSTLLLSPDIPGTALLTLTSSDPSRVLVSLAFAARGAASVSLPVAALQSSQGRLSFYLTGLAENGDATITISLQGFDSRQVRVRLSSPVVSISGNSTSPIFVDAF